MAARVGRWPGSVAAAAALLLSACGGDGGEGQAAPKQPAVVQVGPENIAVARLDTVRTGPSISGTLQPQDAATVNAEVAGSVLETYVDRGVHVRRGQLLLRIDDLTERQSFLSAQSAARSAALAQENAENDLQRDTRLYKAGAIAQRDLEATRRALASAQAASADAHARLATAQQQLGKTRIASPLAGVVSDRPVNAGDVVQPGTPLVTVIDPSSMRLEAAVPSDQAPDIELGAPVRFTISGYPGRTFNGVVQRVNPAVDPTTRQVLIFVKIPNASSRLVAGLFAEGRVETASHPALEVPVDAVDQSGVTPMVTRIEHGKAQHVPVQLGVRDDVTERFEIRSG
ncbi:MAG TPA: efflux RND transporter periplasmic adaptor subunit, partial [Sorangium sp.]|nr:efflux RND transporter periplasmic adaptor subunit [Sorangium sp.]